MLFMDIPLQFHEFHHLNHVERCPKYTEILQKPDAIQPNDLQALYTDLESLQGASNIRLRRLEDEVKILTEWCDKKDRNKADTDFDFVANVTVNKRTRAGPTDENRSSSKKQKVDDQYSKGGSSKIRNKGKATSEGAESESYVSKPKLAYDPPNKFWAYVEPYCSDVTPEDIKVLEDSLTSKIDVSDYFKVPHLGKHYSEIWTKEDFIEEQQQSSKIDKKRSTVTSPDSTDSKFTNIDLNSVNTEVDEACPYGTFTQRLISALVDENIMAPMTENELQDLGKAENTAKTEVKFSTKKSNAKSLEVAIKEELFSLGLIDSLADDEHEYDADDEVLAELRKYQSELKALRSHNKHLVNRLVVRAKASIKKQDIRQKGKVLDAEITDMFRRFSSAKAKKKGFSRKDREVAWKTIREREAIWKMIDNDIDS